jgi:hypothetical protein
MKQTLGVSIEQPLQVTGLPNSVRASALSGSTYPLQFTQLINHPPFVDRSATLTLKASTFRERKFM